MRRPLCHPLFIVLTLVGVLAMTAPAALAAGCPGATVPPSAGSLAQVNRATLCLVNRERTKRGLPRLRRQAALDRAATGFAKRLVADAFFDHTAPDGTSLLDRLKITSYLKGGVQGWSVGENIAYGSGSRATAKAIVGSWMGSSGHRANILRAGYREIGLGVALGSPAGPDGATYVHDFGRRDR